MIKQVYNKQNKSWVKVRITGRGSKILDVKERNSKVPFKGVPKL